MRPEPNEVDTRAAARTISDRRREAHRKSLLRRAVLESLEPRTLLSTLPQAVPGAVPDIISNNLGDESSPSIVVSPNDPNKLIATWSNINDPNRPGPYPPDARVISQAAFSINGGNTWNNFFSPSRLGDPTTSNPTQPLTRVLNFQAVIDKNDHVYLLNTQTNEGGSAGVLVLDAFNFSGATPTRIDLDPSSFSSSNVLERWTANPIHDATIAVDDFTPVDPATGFAGPVYVSYITTDATPALYTGPFNPNRVALMTSSDGGVSFSTPRFLNAGGNFGNGDQRNAAPRIAVSRGTDSSGVDPGHIDAGRVNVIWDDFGSAAGSSPPADLIKAEQATPGNSARISVSGDPINDSPGNNVVATTNIPITITAADIDAGFVSIADLDFRLTLLHPGLNQVSAVLVPPLASGRNSITLFNTDDLGGANLGILTGGVVGTTFDDSASRNIFDPNNGGNNANASPYVGTYRPRTGSLTTAFSGMTPTLGPNGFLGTWTLRLTDNAQNTGTIQQVDQATIVLTSGFQADPESNGNANIATTFVRGGLDNIGLTTITASPIAIGPAPVIASNNTLGTQSPYQGRLYAAYVNYIHPTAFGGSNPTNNTDIHLSVSDDGGITWTAIHGFADPVNDDIAGNDGFSQSIINFNALAFDGRSQFAPAIAVDQSTGTLAMSWYDARNDTAGARVATYFGASIDGGSTFSPQTYANADYSAINSLGGTPLPGQSTDPNDLFRGGIIDSVTGLPVRFGPVPDNLATPNPVRDTVLGFGRGQALAAAAGRAFAAWSGNFNFAGLNNDGSGGADRLEIFTNQIAFGAGPRVVDDKKTADRNTMGRIEPGSERRLVDASTVLYNDQLASDGTPIFNGVVVAFDRPIYFDSTLPIDPLSFGIDDIRVFFRDTTTANTTGGAVAIQQIIPLIDPNYPDTPLVQVLMDTQGLTIAQARIVQQRLLGPSRFLVVTAPRGGVGTYSYQVTPNYIDTIPTTNRDGSPKAAGNLSDQNANAIPAQPLANGAARANVDLYAAPSPVGTTINLFNNPGNPNDPRNGMLLGPFDIATLPVLIPGPSVEYTTVPGEPFTNRLDDGDPLTPGTGDTLATDRAVQGLDLTFDRDMQVGSLSGADVLRVDGPAGPINGPFTIRPVYRNATAANIPDGGVLQSSIVVPASATNFTIEDLDVNINIRHPHVADLTIELIGPDGTSIILAQGLGGAIGRDYEDTIFDDGGLLDSDPQGRTKKLPSIGDGNVSPPFTGRFTPHQALIAFQGKTLATPGSNIWALRVTDSTGGNLPAGELQQLVSWSITARAQNPASDVVARSFRVEFFTPDPTNASQVLPSIQTLSGTYAVTLGTDVFSARGDRLDQNRNAGLDQLRGLDSAGATTPMLAQSVDVPRTLADANLSSPGVTTSSINVTDDFLVQGLKLSLTINHPRVRDLTAVLITPAGDRVTLFSPKTLRVDGANFTLTTFDDSAATFVYDGGPPYFGSYRPEEPLSGAYLDPAGNPRRSPGVYTLEITDSRIGSTGTLAAWSLTFAKPLIGDGLGEPVADRGQASFRIFTMDPTDPVSSANWTPVGPAAVNADAPDAIVQNRWAGRVSAIAVDPSDPSGNTVYVSGASGGVWKTSNFLTTDPAGPSYTPLTDFGPNYSLNIGSIAVFARNGDPNQSIIIAATGEGDDSAGFGTGQSGRGIGFLRSADGGRTWQVVSGPNATNSRGFVGLTAFKVVVDPTLSAEKQALFYAAFSGTSDNGTTGGFYRSNDSGLTWEKMSVDSVHGTQATDIILDPFSADVATRNFDRLYVGFRGVGVFRGTSRGQNLTQLLGGIGKPLVQDPDAPPDSIDVVPPGLAPAFTGRIVLAQVTPSGIPSRDLSYQDWLYVATVDAGGDINALYSTKDRGDNWTRVRLSAIDTDNDGIRETATGNVGDLDVNVAADETLDGNFAISLAVDPNDPQVVYVGGVTLIRVDTRLLADGHNTVFGVGKLDDGGQIATNINYPATIKDRFRGLPIITDIFQRRVPYSQATNLVRNPATPLSANATFFLSNVTSLSNDGGGATWTFFGGLLQGATRVHELLTIVDPLTGQSRIIAATDQGVFSGVDYDGTLDAGIGQDLAPTGTRNGNLQIAQIHYGAAQPSNLAAQIAGALFYGGSWQLDFPGSDPDILSNGNLGWTDRDGLSFQGSGTGVATAQVNDTSAGAVYEFKWPNDGGRFTDFFQVNGIGRVVGLNRTPDIRNDAQWYFGTGFAPVIAPGVRFGNFTVNPINNDQVVMSSGAGRIYATSDQARTWREIGIPQIFGNANPDAANLQAYAPALAFGAPEPGVIAPGSLDDFIYAGTVSGRVFVTRTGGGPAGTAWTDITANLDGSSVLSIVASPNRGSREVYALTRNGIYYKADGTAAGNWTDITRGLTSLTQLPFANPSLAETDLIGGQLHSLVADWRYLIPEDITRPISASNPAHPILYASGLSGVFRIIGHGTQRLPNGSTAPVDWTSFPDNIADGSTGANTPTDSGYLPNVRVTDLDLALGFINPDNGRPLAAGSPNMLVASTYGRGQYAIRLAPQTLEASVQFSPTLPAASGNDPAGSDTGLGGPSDPSRFDRVTKLARPYIEGLGEQTAFGNVVRITIYDLTDPSKPRIVGGYDPTDSATDIDDNHTDDVGRFSIQINAGAFKDDGTDDGKKILGIQAVNASGTRGNLVLFRFELDTLEPPTPTAPDLIFDSDTGPIDFPGSPSNFPNNRTDDYTYDTTPTFSVGSIEAGNTVFLFRDGVQVASIIGAPAGTAQITDQGPVLAGTYVYTVRQYDKAGNPSVDDPARTLQVTVDTLAPNTPGTPSLVPDDDTGTLGDNATSNTQPRVSGTLVLRTSDPDNETTPVNFPIIQIVDSAGTVLGQDRVAADGTYVVRFASTLTSRTYTVRVRAIDRAGNISTISPSFDLTIDSSSPPTSTIRLFPADDTGTTGDNTTSVRRPRITGTVATTGTAATNLRVQLYDVLGNITGSPGSPIGTSVVPQSNGQFTIQFPTALADGDYQIVARAFNNVGTSTDSNVLNLRIDSTPPVGVPDLRLEPADDTGIKGDGRTSNRRPHLIGTTDPNAAIQIVGPNGDVLASGTADATGAFRLQLASNLVNGSIALRARSRDTAGNLGGLSNPFNLTIYTTYGDYDTDGKADLALFRKVTDPGYGQFYILRSALGGTTTPFGAPDDIPFFADFDGDGIGDIAVFRPESTSTPGAAEWLILGSRTGARSVLFGAANGFDLPAPGDYDGDGTADIAVFRPNSDLLPGAAEWFFVGSRIGARRIFFGAAGNDIPAQADYDGDGITDLATFRPDSDLVPGAAQWFILPSGPNPDWNSNKGAYPVTFGAANQDVPIPADYDGDGRDDLAVYRVASSQWLISGSAGSAQSVAFGAPGDNPAPADYDGDGKADLAVFRPSTAQWTLQYSAAAAGSSPTVINFGAVDDIPVLSPLAFRDDRPGTVVDLRRGGSDGGQALALSLAAASAPAQATSNTAALDIGQQAARLSAGPATSGSSSSASTSKSADRARPAQASAAPKAAARRLNIVSWFQRRRAQAGHRPLA